MPAASRREPETASELKRMLEFGALKSEGSGGASEKFEDDEEQLFINDPFTGMDQNRGSSDNGSDDPPQPPYPQNIQNISPDSCHNSQESGPPLSAANVQLPPSASPSDQPPIPDRHPARSDPPTTIDPEITVPRGYPQPTLSVNTIMSSGSQQPPQLLVPRGTDPVSDRSPVAVAVAPPRTPPPAVPTASPNVPNGQHLNGRRREMTPCSKAESAHRIRGPMSTLQKIILRLAMFLMVSTVITMITVFQTAGRGHAAVSKRILLCGVLIIVASSAAAMFAIRKNVGEVLLTMTTLLVLGIFLSSFQDVIYGS